MPFAVQAAWIEAGTYGLAHWIVKLAGLPMPLAGSVLVTESPYCNVVKISVVGVMS